MYTIAIFGVLLLASVCTCDQEHQDLADLYSGKGIKAQKRNINWSRYWGLDRRKKNSAWHSYETEDNKLAEIDSKLKDVEDLIIDEAVKYTGSKHGSNEDIQSVKDSLVDRLAAAYNMEKMRSALAKYKSEMQMQMNRDKQQQTSSPEQVEYGNLADPDW